MDDRPGEAVREGKMSVFREGRPLRSMTHHQQEGGEITSKNFDVACYTLAWRQK